MEPGTVKELKDLESMIINWSKHYVNQIDVHGGNDYLIEDFKEEISFYIVPYIRRLYHCDYLTQEEATEFSNTVSGFLISFIDLIEEYE